MADTLEQMIALAKQGLPDSANHSIEPMGWLGDKMSQGAYAVTNPLTGNIAYNPKTMGGLSQNEVNDILAHELTHSGQVSRMSILEKLGLPLTGLKAGLGGGIPYGQRPEELEAFQVEKDRQVASHRTPSPVPGFSSDAWQTRGDISLPKARRKAVLETLTK